MPGDAAGGLALLQKASFINNKHRIIVRQPLKRIAAHDIAQVIRLPPAAAQNGLLPPGTGIACRLCPHPARLAPLIAKQTVEKGSGTGRNPLLRKERAHPLLYIP